MATVLNDNPDTLKDPAPAAILWEYADSAINYRIQYYIDLNKSGLFAVRTAVLRSVWEAFADNNIEIPFPQRDIHFRNAMLMATPKQSAEPVSTAKAETTAGSMKNEIIADKINNGDSESEE
ncbi:MAG: hypothetical protein CSA45_06700 [Gammaproteobacteria bacterium]|nr:MAG: hypothetical protein CSA45_06700 [Gammaproteobacteria bacterium]